MKQNYVESVQAIDQKLKELTSVDKDQRDDEAIKYLQKRKQELKQEYIDIAKPCNEGESFRCVSRGGRTIIGIVASFTILKDEVIIESYYQLVKGKKKSTLAFFSVPYVEFVKL